MRGFIISLDYKYRNEELWIEAYCKLDSGKTAVLKFNGFKPYFYIVNRSSAIRGALLRCPDVLWVQPDKLEHMHQSIDVLKVFVKAPHIVRQLRDALQTETFFSADIRFPNRFLYDFDLGSHVEFERDVTECPDGYNVNYGVIVSKIKRCAPFKVPLRYLALDIENSIKQHKLYSIGYAVWEEGGKEIKTGIIACETDPENIQELNALIGSYNPDIIGGFNIEGYDIPYLEKIAENYSLRLPWGRDNSRCRAQDRVGGSRGASASPHYKITGRVVFDSMFYAKKEKRPDRHSLNYIAQMILGESKEDVDAKKIDEEWAKDRERVLKYCMKDAELALRILLKLKSVRKAIDIAYASQLPLDEVAMERSSALVDSRIIRLADKRKIAVPLTRRYNDEEDEKIQGASIIEMRPGLHKMIMVLDFRSLYPSVIINYNLCATTHHPDGEIISPLGAKFLAPGLRVGLLPTVLKEILQERMDVKTRLKTATGEEHDYLDGLQYALKIVMNSFYGVITSSFYRFSNKDVGGAVTAFSRENIGKAIDRIKAEFGLDVLYSDTDSVFVASPFPDDEQKTIELGEKISATLSADNFHLEFEKIFNPMFSHGVKKRYFGKIIWPEKKDDLFVRGYETVRTDACKLQKDALSALMNLIIKEKIDDAIEFSRGTVQQILSGDVDPATLVISKTLKDEGDYVNAERMANVRISQKMKEAGYETYPGMKVSWIVTDAGANPQEVEPFIPGVPFQWKPDYAYYARRVAETLGRLTTIFGWSDRALLEGNRQEEMGAFPGEELILSFPICTKESETVISGKVEERICKEKRYKPINKSIFDF